MKKIITNGNPHLCLYATKEIKKGDEVLYDYGEKELEWRKEPEQIRVDDFWYLFLVQLNHDLCVGQQQAAEGVEQAVLFTRRTLTLILDDIEATPQFLLGLKELDPKLLQTLDKCASSCDEEIRMKAKGLLTKFKLGDRPGNVKKGKSQLLSDGSKSAMTESDQPGKENVRPINQEDVTETSDIHRTKVTLSEQSDTSHRSNGNGDRAVGKQPHITCYHDEEVTEELQGNSSEDNAKETVILVTQEDSDPHCVGVGGANYERYSQTYQSVGRVPLHSTIEHIFDDSNNVENDGDKTEALVPLTRPTICVDIEIDMQDVTDSNFPVSPVSFSTPKAMKQKCPHQSANSSHENVPVQNYYLSQKHRCLHAVFVSTA
ncbi:uncharacterized protein LOC135497081 [Lineus longissimus]|uniref:uncharacterized protein LOC135497081 n=1 Tax=Lineus longissimus TaxID=88925 RepID=UPI00315D1E4D